MIRRWRYGVARRLTKEQRRRQRMARQIRRNIDALMERVVGDGFARLRGLSDEEWDAVVKEDEGAEELARGG